MKLSTFQPAWRRSVRLSVLSGSLFVLVVLALLYPLPGHSPVMLQQAWAASIVTVTSSQQSVQGFQPTPTSSPTLTATTSPTSTTKTANISSQVVRLSQLDPNQYANTQEYNTWAYSACSTAAMTEVLNAWWHGQRYRITDVLQQERAANAITPQLGLTDNDGIARTMRRYGFDVSTPPLSYGQLIALANAGTPVIVGWPPARYAGGHLVVVTGGDASTVKLADSSNYNRQTVSRAQFLAWWGGFAAVANPDPYSIFAVGHSQLSADFINNVLNVYHSPMAGMGQQIVDVLAKNGLDTAVALSFFFHESTLGTTGEATKTHSWGNSRCVDDAHEDACIDQQNGGYASFATWLKGLQEWCWQILNPLYAASGLVIVDDIISKYAPPGDHNDVQAYIAGLKHSTDTWRAGGLKP